MAGVGYALLSHWLMLYHPTAPWAAAVLLGPLWLAGFGLGASRFGVPGMIAATILGVGFMWMIWRGEAGDVTRLYVLQHVAINLLLCGWFASTLRAGQLSMIGSFAQRLHPLTPVQVRYTRNVTRVWVGYFAAVAAVSLLVYVFLPLSAWSMLANLIAPVSVGVLMVGEYFMRYRLHPEFERTTLTQLIAAVRASPGEGRAAG